MGGTRDAPTSTRALWQGVCLRIAACINIAVAPGVGHPMTTAMLGDLGSEDEIVVP
ncbi:hypothetical protein [Mycobacterium sp. 852002-51163_SCH5372311]|uniref:hypothetical protein n=1 Tax=Mycobacterium sp. 852002-51163_SCH5372311 TaxID=1834097 RepID=UPI0012E7222A|nr:hypothetical protein [Mycobacterium sp. 852002-51163_SCH5372311]